MRILGTGLNGLVGSRIVELLSGKHEFENLSRSTGVDITDKNQVYEKIKNSDPQIVLHLAAKTNVDECEKDKSLEQDGEAWKINVEGTRNVTEACQAAGKKIIFISTDFVFDGENPPPGGYSEEDVPNPINWYARTKYEGEKIVRASKANWIIVRIAFPYRANSIKLDFFRTILNRLKEGKNVAAVSDQIFMPTFIDDIAYALIALMNNNSQGIFHIVGSQSLTPFEATNLIADEFELNKSKINKTTRAEFFLNRANRPFQLILKSDRITKLGARMRTFEEGLREIKLQLSS